MHLTLKVLNAIKIEAIYDHMTLTLTQKSARTLISPLLWGAWRWGKAAQDVQALNRLIHHCVSLGITSFDHADIYGSYTAEAAFGQALALSPGLRDQVQLLTKCGISMVSPERPLQLSKTFNSNAAYIAASITQSLHNFGADRLDLLMLHRPDLLMDAAETAGALDAAVDAGWVKAVGLSNFSASQVTLLQRYLRTPLAVNQIELSLAKRDAFENGVLDQCQMLSIRPMAWSPLDGGALFGNAPLAQRLRPELARMAAAYACTPDAVALAWLMRHPAGIVPIMGTMQLPRITDAARAMHIQLSREDWYALWVAATGTPLP
jgi:predicted oxidoreductase